MKTELINRIYQDLQREIEFNVCEKMDEIEFLARQDDRTPQEYYKDTLRDFNRPKREVSQELFIQNFFNGDEKLLTEPGLKKFIEYSGLYDSFDHDIIENWNKELNGKAEFKHKAEPVNYGQIKESFDLIRFIFDLRIKQELKNRIAPPEGLTNKQKALISIYNRKPIARLSGGKLYNTFCELSQRVNRIAIPEGKTALKNKIELFESVIEYIDDRYKDDLIKDLEPLKESYNTEYI